jgi:hypothetical protein
VFDVVIESSISIGVGSEGCLSIASVSLSDHWEDQPYVVLKQSNLDIPVFVVRRENGTGKNRTLHRNLLLPVGHLPNRDKIRENIPDHHGDSMVLEMMF